MAQVLKNCKKVEDDFIVEVSGVPTIGQLTINCKGKDIEIDAVRLINDDLESILVDLKINTYLKEEIDSGILLVKESVRGIREIKTLGVKTSLIDDIKDHVESDGFIYDCDDIELDCHTLNDVRIVFWFDN